MVLGASGGHIFPSLAIAKALQRLDRTVKVFLVHSGGAGGRHILASAPWPVFEIPLGGLARGQSFKARVQTVLQIPWAFVKACRLIRRLKAQVVFGAGGSLSWLFLLSARLMLRRTALWEGNRSFGLGNRMALPFVSQVFTVFGGHPKKHTDAGYPLRLDFEKLKPPPAKRRAAFQVLILGGSQGASALNRTVSKALEDKEWRKDIFFLHQTGEGGDSHFDGGRRFAFDAKILQYIESSDVIFSRAGAGAIAEVSAIGKPLVLIPLPKAAGGLHQMENALSVQAAAYVVSQENFTAEKFKSLILSLKNNRKERLRLSQALKKLHKPNGAFAIARALLAGQKRAAKKDLTIGEGGG